MCRAPLKPTQLTHIAQPNSNLLVKVGESKPEAKLRSKPKELLEFLVKNPEARVLIFSRYENPFTSLGVSFEEKGISYHMLKGNKDVIAAQIRAFETGEKRVLFLPTETAAAGMNLVSATHVVLLHAMTPDEEKQVIGRAYRLGRKNPLQVIHLLHEGEQIA
jgi:SNF2 family DNA or RNA helicase